MPTCMMDTSKALIYTSLKMAMSLESRGFEQTCIIFGRLSLLYANEQGPILCRQIGEFELSLYFGYALFQISIHSFDTDITQILDVNLIYVHA